MDSTRFNSLIEKVRFSLDEKRSSRWISPNIRQGSVNISAIREKYGITHADLGEMFGVSESTIRAWEDGTLEPDRSVFLLLRIAERRPDAFLEALWNY